MIINDEKQNVNLVYKYRGGEIKNERTKETCALHSLKRKFSLKKTKRALREKHRSQQLIYTYIHRMYVFFFSFTSRVIRDDVEIAIGAAGQRTNKE